jgi:hypothetical protein
MAFLETVIAHLYDLKSDVPSQYLNYHGDNQLYVTYATTKLRDGTLISEARIGSILEDIEKHDPHVFRPLVYENELIKVKISIRLPEGLAGGKIRGLIVYKVEIQLKKPVKGALAALAVALLREVPSRKNSGKVEGKGLGGLGVPGDKGPVPIPPIPARHPPPGRPQPHPDL